MASTSVVAMPSYQKVGMSKYPSKNMGASFALPKVKAPIKKRGKEQFAFALPQSQEQLMKDLYKLKQMEQKFKYLEICQKMLDKAAAPKDGKDESWAKDTLKKTATLTKKWFPAVAPYALTIGFASMILNNAAYKLWLTDRAHRPIDIFFSPAILLPILVMSLD